MARVISLIGKPLPKEEIQQELCRHMALDFQLPNYPITRLPNCHLVYPWKSVDHCHPW